ncbi:hypothetical protein JY409_00255 [Stenotrophomonas maltophilia]|nr:hypothetical protein [Stenotrophomonas maltophilia]
MSLWSGISPCMNLGVDGCVVWWEAWAAIAAGIAAAVTGVLGYMTFRLGVATTNATKASVDVAAAVKRRDDELRAREVQFLGRLIFPEVTEGAVHFKKLLGELTRPEILDDIYEIAGGKEHLISLVGGPGFPRCNEQLGRLPVFPARICDALGQGLGYVSTARSISSHFERKSSRADDEAVLAQIVIQVGGAARCFDFAKEELKSLVNIGPDDWT